jgi:hypothetical protein
MNRSPRFAVTPGEMRVCQPRSHVQMEMNGFPEHGEITRGGKGGRASAARDRRKFCAVHRSAERTTHAARLQRRWLQPWLERRREEQRRPRLRVNTGTSRGRHRDHGHRRTVPTSGCSGACRPCGSRRAGWPLRQPFPKKRREMAAGRPATSGWRASGASALQIRGYTNADGAIVTIHPGRPSAGSHIPGTGCPPQTVGSPAASYSSV